MRGPATTTLNREAIRARFRGIRARSSALFELLNDEWYFRRPIALRNPIVFYEGHLPAFAVNTLIKRGLGLAGVDGHLEGVFARGIDPESEATAIARGNPAWPDRQTVRDYAAASDRLTAEDAAGAVTDPRGLLHDALRHAVARAHARRPRHSGRDSSRD